MDTYLLVKQREEQFGTTLDDFEPLRVMAIIATYLRAGRGSESVWFQGPKTSPKVPVILYGAT